MKEIKRLQKELEDKHPNHCLDCEGRGHDNERDEDGLIPCDYCIGVGLDPLDTKQPLNKEIPYLEDDREKNLLTDRISRAWTNHYLTLVKKHRIGDDNV